MRFMRGVGAERSRPVGGAALLAALLALAGCDDPKPAAAGAAAAPAVTVSAPVQRRLTEWDEYTGRFASAERVEIRPRVNGYLDTVHFEDGQIVKEGDLLFTIDPRPYDAAVAGAEATLAQARARVVFARGQVERAQELRRTDAIAGSTSDQRLQELQVAAAEALGAEAAAARARLDVEFTQVRAPVAGRVGRALVRPGNLVSGDATLLTTVVSLDPIHFYFDADQNAYLRYQRLAREGLRPSSREEANPVQLALSDEQGWPHRAGWTSWTTRSTPAPAPYGRARCSRTRTARSRQVCSAGCAWSAAPSTRRRCCRRRPSAPSRDAASST